jgi:predicted phage terminase large subunit-like protein
MKQNVKEARLALDFVLRNDFESFLQMCFLYLNPGAPFLPNWHIKAIAHQLDRVRRGEITRLIINMPPRYLKSLTVTVAFTAFLLGHEPWRRIFAISYGDDLSAKHASDFRSTMHSPWFKRAFTKMRIRRSVDGELITTKSGFRRSTSVSGPLTGLGGDLFIIDDPQKPADAQSEARRNTLNQWFSNTLRSRLDNKETGAIIVVMQRVHMDDLSGFLSSSSDGWEVLSLPAIAEVEETIPIGNGEFYRRLVGEALHPALESIDTIRKQQQAMGPDVFAAQYQQSPVPPGGAMVKRAWLRYYDKLPEHTHYTRTIQSWDTAAKDGAQNDWSVCTTWLVADEQFYLLDLTRGRYEYPQLRDTALALAKRFKPDEILIEDASTGIALAQELKQSHYYYVNPIPVDRDKIGRLYVQQAKFAAGRVHFPRDAAFLAELEAELLTFPQARTDDQVDSISQALAYDSNSIYHSMRWVTGE